MLTLRFVRRGRNKLAFFDLVVAEKARAVQKKFINKLGYYNPHTNKGEGELVFDTGLVKKYIANGAQMSQRVARELLKAGIKEAEPFIEKRATKPKKEVSQPETAEAEAPSKTEEEVENSETEETTKEAA